MGRPRERATHRRSEVHVALSATHEDIPEDNTVETRAFGE